MKFQQLINSDETLFIVPLDHPEGDDTRNLSKTGVQGFVNQIDHLQHDGYIFHSQSYLKHPVRTQKDFFLTVGESPDLYLCDPELLKKHPEVRNLTIFYEVNSAADNRAYEFYHEYVNGLKKNGYFVMGMGFPPENVTNCDYYQHIADIAKRLGCDAFKTDYFPEVNQIVLGKMKMFIGGGQLIRDDRKFENFVSQVTGLNAANCSFGRNIFESDHPEVRINLVLRYLRR